MRGLVWCKNEIAFAKDRGMIYGQRQGRYHCYKVAGKIDHMLFGNPKKKASAKVTVIDNKVPRYFLLVAQKSAGLDMNNYYKHNK